MVRPRILIIEDNPTHQRLAALLCHKHGAYPVIVSRADDAIREVERSPTFELVLLDLGVPKMIAGRRCLQELVALRRRRNLFLPIIALTAHAMEGDQQACLNLGADGYLSKPYTSQQFANTLRRWTDYGSVQRQAS